MHYYHKKRQVGQRSIKGQVFLSRHKALKKTQTSQQLNMCILIIKNCSKFSQKSIKDLFFLSRRMAFFQEKKKEKKRQTVQQLRMCKKLKQIWPNIF